MLELQPRPARFLQLPAGRPRRRCTVYLARTLAAVYGNIDWGTKELERSAGQSEVQAWAWDQETNSRKSRSIIIPHVQYTGGKGQKTLEGAREIDQNNNSVAARAEREMLFGIMDSGYVEEAKRLCRETLERGENGKSIPERATAAVDAFARNMKVTRAQLEKNVGRSVNQWSAQDIASLEVLYGSLNRNEISKDEAFPPEAPKVVDFAGAPKPPAIQASRTRPSMARCPTAASSEGLPEHMAAFSALSPGPRP